MKSKIDEIIELIDRSAIEIADTSEWGIKISVTLGTNRIISVDTVKYYLEQLRPYIKDLEQESYWRR